MGQSWALERSREITGECCSVKVAQALPLALSPTSECWRDFRDLKKKIELFCGGDFVHDGLRRRAGVGGGEGWPGPQEEISACTNCFGRGGGASLIIILRGRSLVLWPDAGCDNQEISPTGFANRPCLLYGSNDAISPGFLGKLREFQHSALRGAADAHFAHGFLIHAGEDSDREQPWPVRTHWLRRTDSLCGSMEHCATAQRVYVHELHSGHGGAREYGASDCVGN